MSFVVILERFTKYALKSEKTTMQAFNEFVKTLSDNELLMIKGKSLIMIRTADIQKRKIQ